MHGAYLMFTRSSHLFLFVWFRSILLVVRNRIGKFAWQFKSENNETVAPTAAAIYTLPKDPSSHLTSTSSLSLRSTAMDTIFSTLNEYEPHFFFLGL